MSQHELALLGVALALVLLTGRRALPALLMRLRPELMRCWFLPADQEAQVLGDSPALVDCLERLKRLHYFLLGVKVEKLPLWGPEYREVALAARDHSAFASIVLQPFGAPASPPPPSTRPGPGRVAPSLQIRVLLEERLDLCQRGERLPAPKRLRVER